MFLSRKCPRKVGRKEGRKASMGPGCFYPGNATAYPCSYAYSWASMGPGCFYPGNDYAVYFEAAACGLQWGRDVSIPEITGATGAAGATGGFNGAGMFLSRKSCRCRWRRFWRSASMGPGCFYPGNIPSYLGVRELNPLQWGRDVSIPEMMLAGTT